MTASVHIPPDRSRGKFLLAVVAALILVYVPMSAQPPGPIAADSVRAQRALASLARQGFLEDAPGKKAGEPVPRSEFATALQRLFDLPAPNQKFVFPDVAQNSPSYDAIQAVAPFLGRQIRCPGCALTTTIGIDQPIDRVEAAVAVTGILLAQRKITVVSPARARQLLPSATYSAPHSRPLQLYLATAVNAGVLRSSAAAVSQTPAKFTRVDLALMLEGVQTRYKIRSRSNPR